MPTKKKNSDSVITELRINMLQEYANHPFKPYNDKRFFDMVQSIRDNGVLLPIIVRPLSDGKYEILSGHNRVKASHEAGNETISTIVREGLTDDEALLIVTKSNLIQRSFESMSHSERASAIANRHKALKNKGNNSEIINEIEEMINTTTNDSPAANKQTVIHRIGRDYSLSKDTIARYLRINRLVVSLKERLDNEAISIRTAVALSYLSEKEQKALEDFLASKEQRVYWEDAKALRTASERGELDTATIEKILSMRDKLEPESVFTVKLKSKTLSERLSSMKPDEIEDLFTRALELHDKHYKSAESVDRDNENYHPSNREINENENASH